ncbi:RING-H2 finger protein ATL67-like [Lolium rigidum]|uniref:RING-H2 finger protein ATL67-like n=1 Tax=Lolium rigidum TaxID=89674 RepID=UPI001F5D90C9|nr:RING-H2 finger protein ATL67-like [Lolium rigidum]
MSSSPFISSLATLGLGYSIAIALGFLVLLASVLLASYFCFRHGDAGHFTGAVTPTSSSSSSHLSITVPRVLFVAEGSESPEAYSAAAAAASSPVGLDAAAIASYPKAPFSRAAAAGDAMCSICLCEYVHGEMLRLMPECRHRFHVVCLDAWLRRSASCPVCRSSPIPTPLATPLATPLSELVPLSHYAADRRRR